MNTQNYSRKLVTAKVARALILALTNSEIFGVTFVKKNGELRNMQCRRGVKKGVKGTVKNDRKFEDQVNNVLTVYDMNKVEERGERGAFRRINLETVKSLRIKGTEYIVEDMVKATV